MTSLIATIGLTAVMLSTMAPGAGAAAVSSYSGAVAPVAGPYVAVDLHAGFTESNTVIGLYEEREVMLAGPLGVDITSVGAYGSGGTTTLTPGSIATGTCVKSYLLHFDAVGGGPVTVTGSVTFDASILGLDTFTNPQNPVPPDSNNFSISDPVVGAAGISYPTTEFGRGTELTATGDSLNWTGNTVTVTLNTGDFDDQVRILTSCRPPTVAADNGSVEVDEGQAAQNTGTYSDLDTDDDVSLSASVGTVTKTGTNSGTWTWSLDTDDGSAESGAVTISADDGYGGLGEATFDLQVNNVAPTITSISASATQTLTGKQVTFTGAATDPSMADTAADFAWQWSVDGEPYSAFGAAGANTFSTSFATCGSHTVSAQASDKDLGISVPVSSDTVSVFDAHFRAPLDEGMNNLVQKGRVIPVKISVECNGVPLGGLTPGIQLLNGDQTAGNETGADNVETLSSSAADTTGIMRAADSMYIYNLQVPSNASVGSLFTIRVRPFGTGADLRVVLQIRK
jgi:hypothetical protein